MKFRTPELKPSRVLISLSSVAGGNSMWPDTAADRILCLVHGALRTPRRERPGLVSVATGQVYRRRDPSRIDANQKEITRGERALEISGAREEQDWDRGGSDQPLSQRERGKPGHSTRHQDNV